MNRRRDIPPRAVRQLALLRPFLLFIVLSPGAEHRLLSLLAAATGMTPERGIIVPPATDGVPAVTR
jgi:hypothetical protein